MYTGLNTLFTSTCATFAIAKATSIRANLSSISLTKILSDEFTKYGKSLRVLTKEDQYLIDRTKDLNKEYKNTLSLSDKLAAGKLKEKDVTLQINKLQEEYARYRDKNGKTNDLEQEAIIRSLALQSKINKLAEEKKQIRRKNT